MSMAKLIDEVRLAWESIRTVQGASGWTAVGVLPSKPGRFKAGRNSPEHCEAILVSFLTSAITQNEKLPEGLGFRVNRLDSETGEMTWLALTRNPNGNLELFSAMVSDVLEALTGAGNRDHVTELRIFLGRIRAWQEFMRRGAIPLSPEQEVGLVGELILLEMILESGVHPQDAVGAWNGPLSGLRDFVIGFGAIEVKTTIASVGLTAKIGSLEQLDDTTCKPIFLCAIKCALTSSGQTINEKISSLRSLLAPDSMALLDFNNRITASGYLQSDVSQYHRRFSFREIFIFEVNDNFPRLTPSNIMLGVVSVKYEINLEPFRDQAIELTTTLKKLKMI